MMFYYYVSNKGGVDQLMTPLFEQSYGKDLVHHSIDETSGYYLADDDFFDCVDGILELLIHDFNVSLTFMATYEEGAVSEFFLKKALLLCNEQCSYLCDVLLSCIIHQQNDAAQIVRKQFEVVPHELMKCAAMYVRCGMNVTRSASRLYIHRNTFNYRIDKFMHITNLDIKNFHNAMYFYYCCCLI